MGFYNLQATPVAFRILHTTCTSFGAIVAMDGTKRMAPLQHLQNRVRP